MIFFIKLLSFLIVEKVDLEKARVVYGWGTYPAWNINRRGYIRRIAKIIMRDDGPWLKFVGRRATFSYHLNTDLPTLNGEYINTIEMQKTAGPFLTGRIQSIGTTLTFTNANGFLA